MAFFAGRLIRHPAMANPTLVILTDRNDLDDERLGGASGGLMTANCRTSSTRGTWAWL